MLITGLAGDNFAQMDFRGLCRYTQWQPGHGHAVPGRTLWACTATAAAPQPEEMEFIHTSSRFSITS